MKHLLKYTALAGILLAAAGATGCQDHFDDYKAEVPVATLTPNTTIAEFKAAFWEADSTNYCNQVPAKENGDHYIISGRVISSDYDGNIFKCLYIQDETGALPLSINQYNLYMTNRRGQEIVIDLTGMYAGKYNGMFQMGFPDWYEQGNCWETSFMAPELFNGHREYNGNPDLAKIDTITVSDFSELSADAEGLQKWQGQLVRFNNARFANAGQSGQTLCDVYHSSGYNQSLNVNGGAINVRTSGYAKFWNTPLPKENCDVVGILSYYGTQGWQLLLNDVNGLMNIGHATSKGTQDQPFTVSEAIGLSAGGTTQAWVKGYIVGTLKPDVTEVSDINDISFEAPFAVDNSLIIAPSPETRTLDELMLVRLADESPFQQYANLADHEDYLDRQLNVQGRFTKAQGMSAVANSTGALGTFEIEGVEIDNPDKPAAAGDGTEAKPYNVSQVLTLGNPGTTAWVTGYIVGTVTDKSWSDLKFSADGASNTNIVLAATPDCTDPNKCIAIQLPAGAVRNALSISQHPNLLGAEVSLCGSLEKYFGVAGVKAVTDYKLSGSTTPDTPDTPDTPTGGNGSADSPFTTADVLALGSPGSQAWVTGYIVGTVTDKSWQDNLEFSASNASNTNIVLGPTPDCKDPNKCIPIQLPAGDVRNALSLQQHPNLLGQQVTLYGNLEKYFGIAGVKSVTEYTLGGSGTDTPDTPDTPTSGGTEANPFTVDQAIAAGTAPAGTWVEGYIIGFTPNGGGLNPQLTADGAVASNVLLASSASETDPAKMMPVQLSSGSAIRAALNLIDNPGNLGKKVKIEGTVTAYFNVPGLKSTTAYVIL